MKLHRHHLDDRRNFKETAVVENLFVNYSVVQHYTVAAAVSCENPLKTERRLAAAPSVLLTYLNAISYLFRCIRTADKSPAR